MSTLHPHWDTTEDDSDPVPVRAAPSAEAHAFFDSTAMQGTSISRKPAAIAGILVVMAVGFFFFRGVNELTGQLASSTDIHITANGFNPSNLTVTAGQQIVWINDHTEEISLKSEELCSSLIGCLNTPTMQKGDRASFIITDDIAPGAYRYQSTTDTSMKGTITVDGTAGGSQGLGGTTTVPAQEEEDDTSSQASSPSAAPATETQEDAEDLAAPAGASSEISQEDAALLEAIQRQLELDANIRGGSPASPTAPSATTVNGIPTNPYTVGSPQAIRPTTPAGQQSSKANTVPVTKHKPSSQPKTGSGGVWAVILGAIAVLLWVNRGSLIAFKQD